MDSKQDITKKTINVALIGYKFMGKAHSNAYRQVGRFFDVPCQPVMKVLCGRNKEAVRSAAARFGWEEYATDWREVVERPDIDLVDIASPNNTHKGIALAAAKAGKAIFCEKPLASSLDEAREMLAAVQGAGVLHMIAFNYRFVPAVQLAKRLIEEGALGQIRHWRSVYLQDWLVDPSFPLVWRLRREVAGSGALGDIAAHSIDLAHFLVGDITEVVGMSETFIRERPLPTGEAMGPVTVDDMTAFLARFRNGAVGTFEATRFATGRKNYNCFEINGSKGSLRWNFESMNRLEFYSGDDPGYIQGFRTIIATEPEHKYVSTWWPPGHIIGYEHTFVHAVYELMEALGRSELLHPNFVDGVKCQAVLDAVARSITTGQWVTVPDLASSKGV